jgi:purine-binding chemotaxis protein CheW
MTEEAKTVNDGPAPRIDWPAIHRRLETVRAALERRLAPTNEEKKKVLKMRAIVLAVEPMENARRQEQIEIVEFLLAYERYAVESSFVREVYPLKELTPLPGAPPFVLGIINVRGRIVSVIDLKRFFDLPEKGLTDLNRVIIVSDGKMEFGLLADAVPGVRRIPLTEIQPPLPALTRTRLAYLKGVTSQRLVVLDGARILADSMIVVNEEVKI